MIDIYCLRYDTSVSFFIRILLGFSIPNEIFIKKYKYHYGFSLDTVSSASRIRIRKQWCFFYIEKDLAHKIYESEKKMDWTRKSA